MSIVEARFLCCLKGVRIKSMPLFSQDTVAHLASLARIDLTQEEIHDFANELNVITEAIEQVSQVAGRDVVRTSHPVPLTNVWRPDVPQTPLSQQEALSGAPEAEDGMFVAPQILGEE